MIRIRGIDHIVLRTTRPERLVRFYVETLGCVLERALPSEQGLTQLRAGDALIDIVAVDSELGRAGGGPPASSGNSMDHFCLRLGPVTLRELREWLEAQGVDFGEFSTRYGADGYGPSVYVRDPDGNTVELRPGAPEAGPAPAAPTPAGI